MTNEKFNQTLINYGFCNTKFSNDDCMNIDLCHDGMFIYNINYELVLKIKRYFTFKFDMKKN